MTDTELLSDVQTVMLEPRNGGASWPSGLWNAAEVLAYLNQRQHRFMKETAIVTATGYVNFTAGQPVSPLPFGWIATVRVTWRRASNQVYTPLVRGDTQGADWGRPDWRGSGGLPVTWSDSEDPPPQLRLIPTPDHDGRCEIVYVALADPCVGLGTNLTVPDVFVVHLRHGVLADMFGKQGRTFDPTRAAYCEGVFNEGLQLAVRLLRGLTNGAIS